MSSPRPIRVGVSGHNLKFWMPLQRALEATGRYEFRHDKWRNHDGHDVAASKAMVEWADVLVSEWALGSAAWYSKHKKPGQRLVVRWHRQELETRFPGLIDYSNVDAIAFVGPHILRECLAKFPAIPPEICTVIGNFIDVDRLALPKMGDADTTLGIVGIAPAMKRLDLAVDTLEHLLRQDSRYMLRVKGASPASLKWLWMREDERDYYQGVYSRINSGPLRYKVVFDPQGDDIPMWMKFVGTVLSPSDFESFHMALAEGAASGAYPILWERVGAQEIFPEFPTVKSAEEAADQILLLNRSATGPRLRQQAREMVRDRYDAKVIAREWTRLIEGGAGTQAPVAPQQGRDVIVVWAIDNWPTFHRREMLQALAANVADTCDVLIVEPGNHLDTIAQRGWAPREELERMAARGMVH
ncbi:MAG: glycosyltransferase family 4 protein, partial [Lysobacter sp.]|nr:glycosyltransferase family 4 protein [Lysobacter sp.]